MTLARWTGRATALLMAAAVFSCMTVVRAGAAPEDDSAPSGESRSGTKEIRVLIYWCDGAAKTADIIESLERCNRENLVPGYRFDVRREYFDAENRLTLEDLSEIDVLVVPGGYLYKFPLAWDRDDVRAWVSDGGGYVGICGGEIVAIEGEVAGSFFGSYRGLEIAPNIERINPQWVGERNIRMTAEGTRALGMSGDQRMLHWNGSVMRYRNAPAGEAYVFAVYGGNGADAENPGHGQDRWNPEWNLSAAILGDTFGRGRLVLSGPHPEFPSEDGKFQKPRMLGAMVKWAAGDDSPVPFVIGREDRLPARKHSSGLSALSTVVTADCVIEELHIYIAGGEGRGVLGIYGDNDRGRPGALLASVEPFEIEEVNGWYRLPLKEPLAVSKSTTLWLAWMFDRGAFLPADQGQHAGALGSSRMMISTYRWPEGEEYALPAAFPEEAAADYRITGIYATGTP